VSRPIRIAPSILSADFARLGDEVRAIDQGGADYIHVDVMDGHFVPNLTIGPLVIEALRRVTTRPLDVHLMIANADRYIERYAEAGADILGVHVEACPHLHRTIQAIRGLGKRACAVLNPSTPEDTLRYVLDDLSMVLVMSVNPGFGGQSFLPAVLPKITALRRMIDERGLDVVAGAGANVIVSGSGIFGASDYAATIAAMRERAAAAIR
jgi:ribulose-phosphate 3-epimerase